ncbi:VOC family protein [Pontibacter sp. HSC-14F20]|uniref:VOC family protein n=1 Tax=Pontibacter sp. HSC-14F20 TaxID=2864136 RepID=UPI001C72B24F|nr:VOC family protein [Pontibacter sp. HSC-14F20]MBX0333417.1 VOC family protein [Pontibacter sp. HSC-14F20]
MKITALELQTSHPAELKAFYTQVLGLPLLSEDDQSFSIKAGYSTLTFRTADTSQKGGYHLAFHLPGHKIQEAAAWIQDRVAFLYEPGATAPVVEHENWQAKSLYFYDPAYNLLEFISHSTTPASSTTFGPEQLTGIAEVGLPVTDVAGFAQELREKFELPRWKSATALFEAVGDAEGLLIVVQAQRPWFPTQNPALPLPMHVVVQTPALNRVAHDSFVIESDQTGIQV